MNLDDDDDDDDDDDNDDDNDADDNGDDDADEGGESERKSKGKRRRNMRGKKVTRSEWAANWKEKMANLRRSHERANSSGLSVLFTFYLILITACLVLGE